MNSVFNFTIVSFSIKRFYRILLIISLILLIPIKIWAQTPEFSANITSVCSGSDVTFTDQSTGFSGLATYAWDFGAGASTSTANGIGPHVITYTGSGTNTVVLTVTEGSAYTETKTDYITIIPLPTANAGAALSDFCQTGTSAPLAGSVGGSATGGTWSTTAGGTFNSGPTNLNTTWTPPAAFSGTATLILTTSGSTCGTDTDSKTQIVDPNAVINLSSAGGTDAQDLCINIPITNISYAISGGGTGAGVIGLPAGVTGNFNAGTFTISGTPTASGTFNYTVTTSGTCAQTTALGSITVNPDAAIVLSSAVNTDDQTLCISTPITNITYAVSGGGTGAGATGLPAGVTGNFNAGTFTISGTPSVSGPFNYTVTTTGSCVQASDGGAITVIPLPIANAGSALSDFCQTGTSASLAGSVGGSATGGTWSTTAGGTFNSGPTNLNTTWTPPAAFSGTATLILTTSGSTCGTDTDSKTQIVDPNAVINLSSAGGTDAQDLCINIPITNISYAISGGGTGAGVIGLPAGVTGNFNAGTFTISGTPTASGTFNYTVTTSGTCAQTTALGSITVNPDAAIVLSSAVNTDDQTLCISTPITNITYAVSGGGTGAGVTGLPAGVTGNFNAGTFTISGTPSVSGPFNYTVSTSGTCVQTSDGGAITVIPLPTANAGAALSDFCQTGTSASLGGSVGGSATGGTWSTTAGGTFNSGPTNLNTTWTPPAAFSGTATLILTTSGSTCGTDTDSKTQIVDPNAVINLSSAGGTDAQDLCINIPITNISYAISGGGTGAGVIGLPAGVTGNFNAGTFTISGTPTASGTFNYTLTTSGTCAQTTALGSITVNPDAAIVLSSAVNTDDQTLCISTPITNITYAVSGGGTGAGVTGLPAGVTGNFNAGTFTISGTPSVSGPFNYTVTTTGSCVQASDGGAITVNPLPTATISGTATVCEDDAFPVITFTGASGTDPYTFTYNINGGTSETITTIIGNSISFLVSTNSPGTISYNLLSVVDGSSTTCSQTQTSSAVITINPLPVVSAASNSPVCAGTELNLLGGASGMTNYSWVGPDNYSSTLQNPTVSNSATALMAGGYTLTVINSNGCQSATSTSVIVNPLPVASTSNNGPVCAESPLSLTGGPDGMSLYSWTGPNSFVSTAQSPLVSGTSTLAMAGVYNLSIINSNGCVDASATTVTVNPLPTATISGTTEVCRDGAEPQITFTGANGTEPYIFTYRVNTGANQTVTTTTGSSVTVSVPTGTAGEYIYSLISVQDGSSSTCLNTQTGSATVTVNPLPTATISGTTAVCRYAAEPDITFTGASGTAPYTFTYTINGGGEFSVESTGNSATVSVSTNTPGDYLYTLISVQDGSSTSCLQAQTGSETVTVNALPVPTASNNGPVCAESSLSLIGGPDGMTNYSWTGPDGFTSALQSPTVSNSATAAMEGVYSLTVTNTNGCQDITTTSVIVNPLPIATASNNGPVCAESLLDLIGGPAGMTSYSWTGPNSFSSSAQNPTISTNATVAMSGVYSLLITNSNSCQSTISTTTVVNPLPTSSISGTTELCEDSPFPNITFTGGNGTAPYTFTYRINGGGYQTITTSVGNFVTVQVPTGTAGIYTYNLASVQDASSTACSQSQSGTAVVTINPLPTATIEGTTAVCKDDGEPNITFTGANGTAPYTFIYTINSGSNQVITTTSGSSVSIAVPTINAGTFTYSLVSVQDASATSCSQSQGGSASVTVNPLPTATISGTTDVCKDSPVTNVTLTGGNGTAPYTFTYTINGGGTQTVTSVGNTAILNVPTNTADTYTYTLTSVQDASSTSCIQAQSGNAIIIVNPLPSATIEGTTQVCKDGAFPDITFTGTNGTEPYTFVYTVNSSSDQTVQTSTGSSVTVAVPTGTTGVFTYSLVSVTDASSTSCTQTQAGSATVTINPLPTATIDGTIAVCENAISPDITFTGASGSTPYTFSYRINSGTPQSISTTIGDNVTVAAPTGTPGTYTYTLLSVLDGSISTCEQTQTGDAEVTVNPLPTASISGTATVCQNSALPEITFTGASGTTPYLFNYNINGGTSQSISTSSGNSVTIAVPTSADGIYIYNLLSVQDASSTSCINTQTGNATITVNPLPLTSVISGNQSPACGASGMSYNVTLNTGSNYAWTVPFGASIVSGATGPNNNSITVDFGANNGNISVIETLPTGCAGLQVDSPISLQGCALDAEFITSSTSLCNGSSIIYTNLSTGTSVSTTYDWDFGTGASPATASGIGPHPVSYTGIGTKTVSLLITEGASDTETKTNYITVNPLPTATISGTTDVCRDAASPEITFVGANGTTPYTFTYNINGGGDQTITTTTGNSVTAVVPTITAGTYTYNLLSVQDASSSACILSQTGSAIVIVNPLPTAIIEGTTEVCLNETAPNITFTGSDGTEPYTFTYTINGGAPHVAVSTGAIATVIVPTTTEGTFVYDLVSVLDNSSTTCSQNQTGNATVIVNPLPTATISGTIDVCQDAASPNITFIGANGTAPYTFTYNINASTSQTVTTTVGNSVTVGAPTVTDGEFTYTLLSVQDASNTACIQLQTGEAIITVNPLPSATISGTTEVCKDASFPEITFTGANGTAPYTFTYTINGGSNQTVTSIVNSAVLTVPTGIAGTFTYTLISVRDASTTSCIQSQSGNADVIINPLPSATIIGTTAVCMNAVSPDITFTGANGTAPYTFTYNINSGANETVTTTIGNSIAVPVPTGSVSIYTYSLVSVQDASSTACIQNQSGGATVTINPLPSATISGTTEVCKDGSSPSVTFSGSNGTVPYTFTYTINGGNNQVITTTSGSSTSLFVPTSTAGVFTYALVSIHDASSTACEQIQTGSAIITINPLPTATIDGTTAVCKDAISPDIIFTGANGTTPYTFTYTINSGLPQTVTTSSGSSVAVAVSTIATGTYTYSLVSVSDGTITACQQTQAGSASVLINPLPTASIGGTTEVCRNGTSPIVSFTGANGTAPYTFTYTINGGGILSVTTSAGSSVGVPVPTGITGTYTYNLESVQDASTTACIQSQSGNAVVTVNTLPTATIGGSTEVCRNGTAPEITFTGANGTAPYTFTFTIDGGSNQTITTTSGSSVTLEVPTGTTGTFTYALQGVQDGSITSCYQVQTGNAIVTVNPLPSAIIEGAIEVCQDALFPDITFTGANGTAPYTFTYTINGGGDLTTTSIVGNSVTVPASTITSGTFTYNLLSVQDATLSACTQPQSGSAIVTVNPLPTATISGTTAICQNSESPDITFTGADGTAPYSFTYRINGGAIQSITTSSGNSVSVAVPTATAGSYNYTLVSVQDASSTSCIQTQSGSVTVTVNPLPVSSVISGNQTPACGDIGITYDVSLSSGSNYSWMVPTGSVITAGETGPNNNSITVDFGTNNGNVSVVETLPTGCSGEQRDLAISLQGCNLDADFITSSTSVCNGSSITYTDLSTGTSGSTTYNWDFGTGASPATAIGIGPHPVSYTGIGTKSVSLIITEGASDIETKTNYINVNPLPTATISGTTDVCRDGSAPNITFTGDIGTAPYTFTYNINGGGDLTVTSTVGSSVTVGVPTPTAGTFTYNLLSVQDASPSSCIQAQTGSAIVIVNPLPTATIAGTAEVCKDGATPIITFTGANGTAPYTFTYAINGGGYQSITTTSGNSNTLSVTTGAVGTFTYELISVQDASTTTCVQSQTGSAIVTVNPLPTATITGTAEVCRDAAFPNITFTGANGTAPYTFTYNINSGTNQTVTTTVGNSVTVGASTISAGTFTFALISVQDASNTACIQSQTGGATVIVNPLPTATISGTTEVCRDASPPLITFSAAGGTEPYTFTYNINGNTNQTVTTSSGNSLTIAAPTGIAGTYTYSLISVRDASSTSCIQTQTGSAIVTVNPLPTATIGGTTAVCNNAAYPDITFAGANGTEPYTFTYTINSGTQETVTTTSGSSVTVPAPTEIVGTYTYALVSVQDASTTACIQAQVGGATVTINPLPTATISGTTEVCRNGASPNISFNGANGVSPYTFTYTINGGGSQTITTPTGISSISIAVSTGTAGTYTYSLESVQDASTTACIQSQSGNAVVTVNTLPTATIGGSTEVCRNGTAPEITFTGANGTAPYTFTFTIDGGSNQTITTTSGSSVTLEVPTGTTGTFTYALQGVQDWSITSCYQVQTGNAIVTVNPLPSAIIEGAIEVCQDALFPDITFTGANGTAPYTFTYTINGGGDLTTTSIIGNSVTVPASTITSGTFTYNLLSVQDATLSACTQPQSGSTIVTVNPLPTATISGTTAICQNSGSPDITFTGADGTAPYSFTYRINGGAIQSITTSSGNSVSVAVPTATAGSYNYTLASVQDASSTTCIQSQSGSATVTVNPLPLTSVISGNQAPACGDIGITYDVSISSGSSYNWMVPTGSVITAGETGPNNNSITVDFGITNGNVSVIETLPTGCSGEQRDIAISMVGCALNADFTANSTNLCDGSSITFTDLSTGTSGSTTYNWDFGTGASPATAIGIGPHPVSYTGIGTKSVSLIITEGASDIETKTNYITVNPLPTATISGTTDVCRDGTPPNITFTGAVGTAPYTFTYNINGGGDLTVTSTVGSSVTVGVPTSTAGTFIYNLLSVQDAGSSSCIQAQTGSAIVTVNPLPTATIAGTAEVCKDGATPAISFTGANGTAPYTFTYTFNGGGNQTVQTSSGNSATLFMPTGTVGTFTYELIGVKDASTTACVQAQTGSAIVTVNPLPTAIITGTTAVCRDAVSPNITFTGANGTAPYTFTYNINSGTSQSITTTLGNTTSIGVSTGSAGTFTYALLSVQDASSTACIQSQTGGATVTVNQLPTATIGGTDEVCKDAPFPDITFTGANGTPPYTFTYTVNGGGNQTVVTISGNSVTWPVPTGLAGSFTYSLVSVRDGSSTACDQAQSGSAVVTVNPLPTATISGTAEVCKDAAPPDITFTGANGTAPYSFIYTVNSGVPQIITTSSGNSVSITVPTGTVSTYTYALVSVQDASNTVCVQTQPGGATITVNPLPTAGISGTTDVCRDGSSPDITFVGANGSAPYTFMYSINGGTSQLITTTTGSSVTVSAPTDIAGSYDYELLSVQDGSTTACIQTASGNAIITVNPLPTAIISGTTEVCRDGVFPDITFEGANGTAPYTFTYNIDGGSNLTITTTSGNIATVAAPSLAVGSYTYSLVSVQDASSTACIQLQTGNAIVTVNPLPTATIGGDAEVCRDGTSPNITFTGANGTAPYTFSYRINGGSIQTVTTVSVNSVSVSAPTTTAGTLTYSLLSVQDGSSTACVQAQSGSAVIIINPLPTAAISGSIEVCRDGAFPDITFTGANGTAPYTFTYTIDGGSNQTLTTISGNSQSISVPTIAPGVFTYSLVSVQDASSTACAQLQTGNAVVTVNPLPTASISGTIEVCEDGSFPDITFTGANGTAPYTFTYQINGGSNQTITTSGGNAVTVSAPTIIANTYTYTLISVQDASLTTCVQAQSGSAVVTVNPLPTATISGSTEVCRDGTYPNVTFTGANGTAPYTFSYRINSESIQTITTVLGNSISVAVPTETAGNFTYSLVSIQDASSITCSRLQTESTTIIVNPLPTATISGTDAVCQNSSSSNITFTGANGTAPYTFVFRINGGAVQSITTSSGNSVSVSAPTANLGDFIYSLISVQDASLSLCSQAQTGSATITVNPLPTATITGTTEVCTDDTSPRILFTGANGTSPYTFTYRINNDIIQNITTSSGDTVSIQVATNAAGEYSYNLLSIQDASSSSCIQSATDNAVVRVYTIPVSNAGPVDFDCDLDFVLGALPSVGIGTWTKTTGPGNVAFLPNEHDPAATVTVTDYGSYTFTWTEINGPCSDNSTVDVNFYEEPTSNPGTGGSSCDQNFQLGATPSLGIGIWTQSSGPGIATFIPDANTENAVVNVSENGTYTFAWTEVNVLCSNSAEVSVDFYEEPITNAGLGGNNCGLEYILKAEPSVGNGYWTLASGTGTATFAPDTISPDATVIVSEYGDYRFSWTEVNGTCSDSDTVDVSFINIPAANAGDGGEECDLDFSLQALPVNATGYWEKYSGPGIASFSPSVDSTRATVSVDTFGVYEFAWTEVNISCTSTDTVSVVFRDIPIVYAGEDTIICIGDTVYFHGEGDGAFFWTPDSIVSDSSIANPTATPEESLSFTLTLTDVFGCVNSDDVDVEVREAPIPYAGSDISLEYLFNTFLYGELDYDYEYGVWSGILGNGDILDTAYSQTEVKNLSIGENIFLWTVYNSVCPPVGDSVSVFVKELKTATLITPNGDSRNEFLVFSGIENLLRAELVVFDRTGTIVYENPDYNNDWNGIDYNGNPLPNDTYFYILKGQNGISKTSYIVIRR